MEEPEQEIRKPKGKKVVDIACSVCDFKFPNKRMLKRHFKEIHESKRYPCNTCPAEFSKKVLLKKHLRFHLDADTTNQPKEPKPKSELKCQHCGFMSSHRPTLKRHVKLCLTAPRLKCENCEFIGLTKRELFKHMTNEHMSDDYKTCSECGYVALSLSTLEKHKLVHFSTHVYECSLCMFATKYEASLERHIKLVHLNERVHQCQLCDYKSKEKGDLNKHMKVHGYSIYCPFCCEIFTRVETFQKHLCMENFMCSQQVYDCFPDYVRNDFSSSHRNFDKYTCVDCEKDFELKSLLNKHMMKKHPQKCSFLCWLCGLCFSGFKKLREHNCNVKKESSVNNKPEKSKRFKAVTDKTSQIFYQCQYCEYQTSVVKSLMHHTKLAHEQNDSCFQCSECPYVAKRKYDLRKHESLVHNMHIYNCSKCSDKFDSLKKLRRHDCGNKGQEQEDSDQSPDEEPKTEKYQCELCDYKALHKCMLVRHFDCVHQNIRRYPCTQCSYKAKEKGDLKKHFLWVHATVRGPYICYKCKESFDLKSRFRVHNCTGKKKTSKKTETKSKSLHVCSKCQFKTIYIDSLIRHMECVHMDNRPYPCPVCNHRSKGKGDLKKHLSRQHDIDAPYLCTHCLNGFKFQNELKTHDCSRDSLLFGDADYIDLLGRKSVPSKKLYEQSDDSEPMDSDHLVDQSLNNADDSEIPTECIKIEPIDVDTTKVTEKSIISISCKSESKVPYIIQNSPSLSPKKDSSNPNSAKIRLSVVKTTRKIPLAENSKKIFTLKLNGNNSCIFSVGNSIKKEPVEEADFIGFDPEDSLASIDIDSQCFSPPSPPENSGDSNDKLGSLETCDDPLPNVLEMQDVDSNIIINQTTMCHDNENNPIIFKDSNIVVNHEVTVGGSPVKDAEEEDSNVATILLPLRKSPRKGPKT